MRFATIRSNRCQRALSLALLVGALAVSGCHLGVDRPCCRFQWRFAFCGLTSNCHECRRDCGCQPAVETPAPTPAPAPEPVASPVVHQFTDLPYEDSAVDPQSLLIGDGEKSDAANAYFDAPIATIPDPEPAPEHWEGETLELVLAPSKPAPAELVPVDEKPQAKPKAKRTDFPRRKSDPVRAQSRDDKASNTIVSTVEDPPVEEPALLQPKAFDFSTESEIGNADAVQMEEAAPTPKPAMLRLTAIPKLYPSNFPPLIKLQPQVIDASVDPPYQIVIAPLATEPNRRPIDSRLDEQRLGRVLDESGTLRR